MDIRRKMIYKRRRGGNYQDLRARVTSLAVRSIVLFCLSLGLVVGGWSQTAEVTGAGTAQIQSPPLRTPDVVYVATPPEVVERMLEIANINKKDVLYDLGSGDGRIPITAVQKYGASRAVGIDINPRLVKEATLNAQRAGVSDRVTFLNQDLFQSNFSDATIVTLYLLPSLNVKLRPQLLSQLKPGTWIVSHDFPMGDWKPERSEEIEIRGRIHIIYLWRVPEKPPMNLRSLSGMN